MHSITRFKEARKVSDRWEGWWSALQGKKGVVEARNRREREDSDGKEVEKSRREKWLKSEEKKGQDIDGTEVE